MVKKELTTRQKILLAVNWNAGGGAAPNDALGVRRYDDESTHEMGQCQRRDNRHKAKNQLE